MKRKTRIWILVGMTLVAILTVLLLRPWPQDEEYHNFADRREMFGIPHALDVLSNLPFILIGGAGLFFLWGASKKVTFVDERERWPWTFFFLGALLTGLGSAYYHWSPDTATLFWDRLPMAIVAMSLLAAVICDRISVPGGVRLLPLLLLAGLTSVLWWQWGERQGAGDLRAYGLVQFLPLLLIPVILLLFAPRYTRTADYLGALGWYVAAKVAEHLDEAIFAIGGLVSGHTLKHLLAAAAIYWILRMLLRRQPVPTLRAASAPPGLRPKKR